MRSKTFLFVDGSNLYGAQYELFGPQKYMDFAKLIEKLEKNINVHFAKIYFYASYSPKSKRPTAKEKLFLKNEALFYKSVRNTGNVTFFKGYRSKTSGKEKEVDVKLTADLVSFAFLNKFDNAYLFSGDADFLQALFCIRRYHNNKKAHLLCLENKLMYQGLFFFRSYIVVFKNIPKLRRKFKYLTTLRFDTKSIVKGI